MDSGKKILLLNSFVAGFAIMSLEILAARVLANFFGYSIFVWGTAIGIILIALSIGYYLGGIISDKVKSPKLVFFLAIASAAYLLLFLIFYQGIISNLSAELSLFNSIIASSLLVLFVPSLLLSMISPLTTKFMLEKEKEGKNIGLVYAVSNTGGIIGVFLTTFYLIPFFGVRNSIALNVFLCLAFGFIGLISEKKKFILPAILVFLFASGILAFNPAEQSSFIVERKESVYNTIDVKKFGETTWLYLNSHAMSYYEKENKINSFFYDAVAVMPCINGANSFLDLGLAGATVERKMQEFCKVGEIDGIELDAEVVKIAEKHFMLNEIDSLNVIVDDARHYVKNCGKKYGLIFNNTINSKFIPFHLTTKEFFSEISECLEEKGVFVNYSFETENSSLLKESAGKTMKEIFPVVAEISFPQERISLLLGFKSRENFNEFRKKLSETELSNSELKRLMLGIQEKNFDKGAIITDDLNPVDSIVLQDLMA